MTTPFQSPAPNSPVRIGEVVIPFDRRLEQVVRTIVSDFIPNGVMLRPGLQQLGINPFERPQVFDALLTQLLLVPRVMADRSFSAETAARKRVDAGELLTEAFRNVAFEPSQQARYAAAWVKLYLSKAGQCYDEHRVQFLDHRFGIDPAVERAFSKLVELDRPFAEENLPQRIKNRAIFLPPLETGLTWSEVAPAAAASLPKLPAAAEKDAAPINDRREELYAKLCEELRQPLAVIEEACSYRDLKIFGDAKLDDVREERRKLAAAHGSVILERYSRIQWEGDAYRELIPDSFMDGRVSRNFILETPTAIAVTTQTFGVVTARAFASGVVFLIEGKTPDGQPFSIFDSKSPHPWQKTMEVFT